MLPFLLMKKSNLILYHPGCYGNFINWCCSYFTGGINDDTSVPLTEYGSVHGNYLNNSSVLLLPKYFKKYTSSSDRIPFVQAHPETLDGTVLTADCHFELFVNAINNTKINFDKVVYIYPTETSISWVINNIYSKIRPFEELPTILPGIDVYKFFSEGGLPDYIINQLSVQEVDRLRMQLHYELDYTKWEKWGHASISDFALWELRELSSLYFYNKCYDRMYTKQQIEKISDSGVLCIAVDQFRDDFVDTVDSILKFYGVNSDYSKIKQIHIDWLSKQKHINKDQQIRNIVNSLVNEKDMSWNDLSFFDEIFVQRKLLDQGIEIACYELNKFPASTAELLPLLIK